jgi:transcriptional regulator with GAF, ATPase, and Fis domain
MMTEMATTKKKSTRAPAKAPEPEAKPTLAEVGREAAQTAQRKVLLAELKRQDWNLTATARELGLSSASNVLRAIKQLGLDEEYKAARVERIERE